VIAQNLIDRLAEHKALSAAPRSELEWLAAHGTIRELSPGQLVSRKGHQVEGLYFILSGRIALFIDRGEGPSKFLEWHAGEITGVLPYSRLVTPPGDVIVLEPVEILAIPRDHLSELTRECSQVTTMLVHLMLDRSRLFTSSDLHNEKMISLGKLSAGLAHELNNPASAMERCAATLEDRLRDSEEASLDLAAAALSDSQIAALNAARAACIAKQNPGTCSPLTRSALDQIDREDVIAQWLCNHGVDAANAELLADTEVTFETLNQLVAAIDPPARNAAVRWLAAGCAVRNLTSTIQDSAMRISSLVVAVKGYTHMDQANVAEPVDLGPCLSNTVAVLNSRAHGKSVDVTIELEPELPKVRGFAAELNQVWGNLIDNALDAVIDGGRVHVFASRENQSVVVRIRDDGPGIPPEFLGRIFDPFFTTKPLGHGTGLGLDIARRLVRHNDGSIEFDSRPGHTEFRVRLPIAETHPGVVLQ
jgi:signal transduction histidine kinase